MRRGEEDQATDIKSNNPTWQVGKKQQFSLIFVIVRALVPLISLPILVPNR